MIYNEALKVILVQSLIQCGSLFEPTETWDKPSLMAGRHTETIYPIKHWTVLNVF